MNNTVRRLGSFFLSMLILAVPVVAWLERDAIYDAYRLHGYQPPAAIVQLATDDTMTTSGRHLFYVYHPDLEDKATFNTHCSDSEKTIVLGCYMLHRGIYLYKVTEPRLDGVEQVTAAHEMLHAAYDRLSPGERSHINDLINQSYATVTDPRIRATINDYQKAGADTTNELHSILGTEVRNLSPELEQYYTRYFTNRKAIVSLSEQYEAAFSERQALATQYTNQLNSLKQQINGMNTELQQEKASLDSQYNQLQSQRTNVQDVAAFNNQVRAFNSAVAAYNTKVNQVSALIDQYNSIVANYQALLIEENQLYKAIDSRPSAAQTQ